MISGGPDRECWYRGMGFIHKAAHETGRKGLSLPIPVDLCHEHNSQKSTTTRPSITVFFKISQSANASPVINQDTSVSDGTSLKDLESTPFSKFALRHYQFNLRHKKCDQCKLPGHLAKAHRQFLSSPKNPQMIRPQVGNLQIYIENYNGGNIALGTKSRSRAEEVSVRP